MKKTLRKGKKRSYEAPTSCINLCTRFGPIVFVLIFEAHWIATVPYAVLNNQSMYRHIENGIEMSDAV